MVCCIIIWAKLSMFCCRRHGRVCARGHGGTRIFLWGEDSGPASHSPMKRDPVWFYCLWSSSLHPIARSAWGIGTFPLRGWVSWTLLQYAQKEGNKRTAAPRHAGNCAVLFIQSPLEGRFLNTPGRKKLESLWALLHNLFTQTFSFPCFHVRNAEGLHLTYMEGPPRLHPCSVIHFF